MPSKGVIDKIKCLEFDGLNQALFWVTCGTVMGENTNIMANNADILPQEENSTRKQNYHIGNKSF
jgi:hypothetical protein